MTNFREIIERGEYEHYGVRAHRSTVAVGETLGNSRVWMDGECTDDELRGISTLKVTADNVDDMIGTLAAAGYIFGDAAVVLVGGFAGEWGEDAGEYIIRDNICLAIL
jgi:hypothetical protein